MRFAPLIFALGLLVLTGCNKSAAPAEADKKDEDKSPGVHLSAEEMKGLGLATAPAAAARYLPGASGYGVVTSLDAVAQADADLATASAAAAQSQAAAARARSLSTGEEAAISQEQVQVAEAKASSDQAALALARRKADSAFGFNPPWRDAAARTRIMAALGNGSAVLVRATFPLGTLGPGILSSLSVDAGSELGWSAGRGFERAADLGCARRSRRSRTQLLSVAGRRPPGTGPARRGFRSHRHASDRDRIPASRPGAQRK